MEIWRRDVTHEVDAALLRGEAPDADALASRFAAAADDVRAIVAMRRALLDEGLLDAAGDDVSGEASADDTGDADADGEHAIPELNDFMSEALKPDIALAGPAPEPVQEVVLSHFRLVAPHARHPLGGLFLGVDQNTNRHAEVLVIRGHMARQKSGRLLRDALAVRAHPDAGHVPVIDAAEVHDIRYVAWEYQPDLTLDRVIRRLRRGGGRATLLDVIEGHSDATRPGDDPKPPSAELATDFPAESVARLLSNPIHVAAVLDLAATAAEALDRAHARGMILADVRPANIFVHGGRYARLRGFGLVPHARAAWHRLGADKNYLAPEVLSDEELPLDWRADVYGMALVVYALLALKDPPDFAAMESRVEALFLDLRGAPESLLPLIDRSLERSPADRPESCALLAAELRRVAASLRPPPPHPASDPPVPPWVWYGFLTLVALGVLTLVLLSVL